MEIVVFPRAFVVQPTQIPTQAGAVQDAMQILVVDPGGTVLKVVFALPDWEQFQRAVADPAGFALAAKARAKIVAPGGLAPTLRQRKH